MLGEWEARDGLPSALTLPVAASKRPSASVASTEAVEPTEELRRRLTRTGSVGAVGTVTLCLAPCHEHDHERAKPGSFIVRSWPKGHVQDLIARGETHTTKYSEAVRCFAAMLDTMSECAMPEALREMRKRYRATREEKRMALDSRRAERIARVDAILEMAQQNSVGMALMKAGIRLGGLR